MNNDMCYTLKPPATAILNIKVVYDKDALDYYGGDVSRIKTWIRKLFVLTQPMFCQPSRVIKIKLNVLNIDDPAFLPATDFNSKEYKQRKKEMAKDMLLADENTRLVVMFDVRNPYISGNSGEAHTVWICKGPGRYIGVKFNKGSYASTVTLSHEIGHTLNGMHAHINYKTIVKFPSHWKCQSFNGAMGERCIETSCTRSSSLKWSPCTAMNFRRMYTLYSDQWCLPEDEDACNDINLEPYNSLAPENNPENQKYLLSECPNEPDLSPDGVFEIKDSLNGKYLTTQREKKKVKVVLGDSKTDLQWQWHWIPNKNNSVWGYIYQPGNGYLYIRKNQLMIKNTKKDGFGFGEQWRKIGNEIISSKITNYEDRWLLLTSDADGNVFLKPKYKKSNEENQVWTIAKLDESEPIGICNPNPCQNNGNCIEDEENETFTCEECDAGWTGQICMDSIDDCLSSPCLNGGNCIDLHNNYKCSCPDGVNGVNCEVIDCPGDGSCSSHGTCDDTTGICICNDGFGGDTCQSPLAKKLRIKTSCGKYYGTKDDLVFNICQNQQCCSTGPIGLPLGGSNCQKTDVYNLSELGDCANFDVLWQNIQGSITFSENIGGKHDGWKGDYFKLIFSDGSVAECQLNSPIGFPKSNESLDINCDP